jgi:predicted deacylase
MRAKKSLVFLIMAGVIGFGSPAFSARKVDPEIKRYQEEVKEKLRQEEKQERKERRADTNRRVRPYQTLDEIYAELDQLEAEHPDLMSVNEYGKSLGGKPLKVVKISVGAGEKPEILYSANIHAQEMAAGQVCMGIIRKLVKSYDNDCRITRLVDGADIYVIPIMNPDNMEKTARIQVRYGIAGFYRKNQNKVDLNRNFPYPADAPERLKDSAGSPKKYSSTYRGPRPLSEPETRAFIEFIDQHDYIVSMNYHTTGGMIMYPPGTFPEPVPDEELMEKMALEYQALQFDPYDVHREFHLYPTLGSMNEYLYHHYGTLALIVEVGNNPNKRAFIPRNGSLSPIFWMYNVYYLDREIANNLPGAINLIDWAIRLDKEPSMINWKPPTETWVGEPDL